MYKLSLNGAHEDASLTGDLDIHQSLELRGNTNVGGDPSPYVVDARGIDRPFGIVSSASTVKCIGSTIKGGDATADDATGWRPSPLG